MPPTVVTPFSDKLFRRIMTLVENGSYSSIQEFIIHAAQNQIALDESHMVAPPDLGARQRDAESPMKATTVKSARVTTELDSTVEQLRLPGDGWRLPGLGAVRPWNGTIWGQVNRIAPLKVAARAIALMNNDAKRWRSIAEAMNALTTAAAVGSSLESADDAAGRKRDDLLATGFPRVENTPSRHRFVQQYLGRPTRTGQFFAGAIYQFSLATTDENSSGNIISDECVLTSLGLEFAQIWSPILDGDIRAASQTLSDEERLFFLRRVLPHVASELADYRCVLRAVDERKNTPSLVMTAIRETVDPRWNDVMVRTHVSGLIGRMVDLGLLTRVWEGRMVSYGLTPLSGEVAAVAVGEQANRH